MEWSNKNIAEINEIEKKYNRGSQKPPDLLEKTN